jgi:hypothetical protein
MHVYPAATLGFVVFATIACSDTPSAPEQPVAEDAASQFLATRQRPPAIGPEVERYKLAKEIRGFGGYFYDRAGNMHVYLTDLTQSRRARSKLQPILRARPRAYITEPRGRPRIILRQGRYDFLQLAAWRDLLRQHIMGRPNIVSLGIDLRVNAISVGVFMSEADVAEAYVRELLGSLPIPTDAVTVEAGARAIPAATLSSFRETLEGGLKSQLSYGSTVRECTMGFNAEADDGTRVFVTNSHCTAERGGTNGTTYWQPDYQVREIGTEYRDFNWLTYLAYPQCPDQRVNGEQVVCRYSDAALVRYHAAMTTRASIARTTFNNTGTGMFGSTTIDPAAPYLPILSSRQFPRPGDPVQKVGFASGWTWGTTAVECLDTQVYVGGVPTRYIALCQARVDDVAFANGDSGSPAFLLYDDGGGNYSAQITGVVWGISATGFYLSHLDGIEYELGPLYVF